MTPTISVAIDDAPAKLVAELPPMERACVLLKDVLDYRLAEVAEVVDSTLGSVKAALHRGRAKLRRAHETSASRPVELDREQRKLLDGYLECFNRRDWDALRRLIQTDARIRDSMHIDYLLGMPAPKRRAKPLRDRPTFSETNDMVPGTLRIL